MPQSPKIFDPDEISAIPPELRQELNIAAAGSEPDVTDGIELEPHGFSWAGLVFGPFYYLAMQDVPFAIWSTIASLLVYTIPLLIPLAFFARKRAWARHAWTNNAQFWRVQRQWDRSAIVGGVLAVIVLFFVSRYVLGLFSTAFGTTDPTAILQQVQSVY